MSQYSPTDHEERWSEIQQLMLLPPSTLAQQLVEQTNRFLKKDGLADDRPGLALFAVAIIERSTAPERANAAWEYLYQQYASLVLTWVNQHQNAAPILGQDGSAPLVNAAFAKFSQALTPTKMVNFDQLSAVLKYLKMCVHSVIADEVRSRRAHRYEEALESIEHEPAHDDPADDIVSTISAQDLWQVIQEELHGEAERVLVYLAYICGMKPSEISSQHSRLFPTVEDVYRIKRNVLERLSRNRQLQSMYRRSA